MRLALCRVTLGQPSRLQDQAPSSLASKETKLSYGEVTGVPSVGSSGPLGDSATLTRRLRTTAPGVPATATCFLSRNLLHPSFPSLEMLCRSPVKADLTSVLLSFASCPCRKRVPLVTAPHPHSHRWVFVLFAILEFKHGTQVFPEQRPILPLRRKKKASPRGRVSPLFRWTNKPTSAPQT